MRDVSRFIAACLVQSLVACGDGLSGRYDDGNANGTSFTFKGSSVEIDALGPIQVGTYEVKDSKVYITIGGQTQALRLTDAGCIDGGLMFGTLCKR